MVFPEDPRQLQPQAPGSGATEPKPGSRASGRVHLVLPGLDMDLWALVQPLTATLRNRFQQVALWPTDDQEKAQVELIEALPAAEPVVVIPARHSDGALLAALASRVAVVVERLLPSGRLDTWVVENYRAGYQAAKHLVNLGHQRIAYLGRAPGATADDERLRGFRQALLHNGRQVDPDLVGLVDEPQEAAAICQRFWQHPQPPTALFAASEAVAVAAVQGLERLSLRIPQDVAVVAYGTGPLLTAVRPKLTAVEPPYQQLAARVAAGVATLFAAGVPAGQRRCEPERLAARLIIRRSCGAGQRAGTPTAGS